MGPPEFQPFGVTHLAAIAVVGLTAWGLAWVGRRVAGGGRWPAVALAGLLAATKVATLVRSCGVPDIPWAERLPLHLCDWAAFAVMAALVTRRRSVFELAYFWGLGGTLQGLVTPDLAGDFPSFAFWSFFLGHGVIVVGVVYLIAVLGLRPRPGAVGRLLLATNGYAAVAGAANVLLGTNFGYLCAKPTRASLLDYLGPWPWYLAGLEIVGVAMFAALAAPFWWARRGAPR